MKIELSPADLEPLIETVVARVVAKMAPANVDVDKLAWTEENAAKLLDIPRHVLRDARLAGEIVGSRAGKRVVYQKADLLGYLAKRRD